LPFLGVEMAIVPQRSDELIPQVMAAVRKLRIAREFQSDMLERHAKSSLMGSWKNIGLGPETQD
jgi:hypothetical protein